MKRSPRGFTLIELLVVIAIIGILSSVVLFFVNGSRKDAAIANIKANMMTIQKQAELYHLINGGYGTQDNQISCPTVSTTREGTLFADPTINSALSEIKKSAYNGTTRCYLKDNATKWSVSARINQSDSDALCVDSTGYVGIIDHYAAAASSGYCNTNW